MSDSRFSKLLEPAYIGKVRLRNRMIKTASGSSLIEKDGTAGERIMGWYEAMAKGGVGLIIFETCSVEYPRGSHRPSAAARLSDDRYIPSFSELTKRVHNHGCPIFIQLMHSGAWYAPNQEAPGDRISASAIPAAELPGAAFVPPRGLSLPEVEEMIEKYVKAAERAQKAGFDGVEINGSHYHLINSFLSRWWNRRNDIYGPDSMENRARFMCTILKEIKKRCGQDFAIDVLFNAIEFGLPYGATTLEESKIFARLFQDAGADSIQLRTDGFNEFAGSLHLDRFFYPELPPNVQVKELDWTHHGKGVAVPLATEIKKAVSVPCYVASRLDPIIGEKYLRQSGFIAMTRRIMADPELPNKIAAGKYEDIAPCTGDLYCWERRTANLPIQCRINASLGREYEYALKPAAKKKKVMIIGAGAAGMEAARVAAIRGHEVSVYDKAHMLGGLLYMAGFVKGCELEDFPAIVRYFKIQFKKLGVKYYLGRKVNESLVEKIKPDVVILAQGGISALPDIPGIKHRKVVNLNDMDNLLNTMMKYLGVRFARWLTKIYLPVGKRVIVVGGDRHGVELAILFVQRGRKVTIITDRPKIGEGLIVDDPWRAQQFFKRHDVIQITDVKYEEITDKGLTITDKSGKRQTLAADTIVPALILKPNPQMLDALKGKVSEIYMIGDCREPGLTVNAVDDGSRIAREI